jgi:DME family drug/metabolite transporter
LLDPTYALLAALIWAFSPIYYRTFLNKFDFLSLNLLRTSLAAGLLALPAIYVGNQNGITYALLSGSITLALGDSLFLLSVAEMGASIATPVVYIYVLLVQFSAGAVGETVPFANAVAAVLVLTGIFSLSLGRSGKPRAKGVTLAVVAAVVWTAGQDLIRLATGAGGNPVVITFSRNFAAAIVLAIVGFGMKRVNLRPLGMKKRDYGVLVSVALSDLALGSLLFVYSISVVGIATTVILTSLSPLLTQIFSRALGKESPSKTDFLGGILIVASLMIAVLF